MTDIARLDKNLGLWQERKQSALEAAKSIEAISDGDSFARACAAYADLNILLADLEGERKTITRQFDDAKKAIMSQEKALAKNMAEEADRMRTMATEYAARHPEADSSRVKRVVTLDYEVVDESKVDRQLLSVDPKKVKAKLDAIRKSGLVPEDVSEPGIRYKSVLRLDKDGRAPWEAQVISKEKEEEIGGF